MCLQELRKHQDTKVRIEKTIGKVQENLCAWYDNPHIVSFFVGHERPLDLCKDVWSIMVDDVEKLGIEAQRTIMIDCTYKLVLRFLSEKQYDDGLYIIDKH